MPGWPIACSEILAHLPEACESLDPATTDFSSKPLGGLQNDAVARVGTALSPSMRFGTKHRKAIVESRNFDLFINAKLVDLHLDRMAKLVTKQFVLTLGSIENAGMLLGANKQLPAGIGNHANIVGRCQMDHLNVGIGRFVPRQCQTLVNADTNLTGRGPTVDRLNVGAGILALGTHLKPPESGRLGPARRAPGKAACAIETDKESARRFKDFNCAGDGFITSPIERAPGSQQPGPAP